MSRYDLTDFESHELGALTPLGRAGNADEVAGAILWLLSVEAGYTTGAFIDITGADRCQGRKLMKACFRRAS
jgi:NAD(P)-dependent dehydrogenase (short-subunit alcohol dehydrogenase family)